MVTASQLSDILSEHYEIGELVNCEQLHLGYVNVSYIIETALAGKRTRYFLRRYRTGIKKEEIEFEHAVINHLVKKDFGLVARVINTKEGRTFVEQPAGENDKVFYALFDFLPGEDRYTWVNPTCTDKELEDAASILARFHHAVSDLSPVGKRYEPPIINLLPQIAANVKRRSNKAGDTVFDSCLLENLGLILKAIERALCAIDRDECKEIVRQVIHCDYHPGNLKFQDSEITGLFDFDWSKVDARCFDVALAITYFCTAWGERDGKLELNKVGTFLNSYQSALESARSRAQGIGPLSETELELLPHMIGASNLYVLNWTVEDFYSSEADQHEYLIYLQHGIRLIRWLESRANWERLVSLCRTAQEAL